MKFTKTGSVQLIAGVIAGASAIIVACGGSDDSTDSSTNGADAGSTSSSTSSSSSSSSSSGSTSSTSSSGGSDAGGDAAKEAGGGDGGGAVANGGSCNADAECKSGHCFQKDYCTVTCNNKQATDPVCQALGGDFTGKCNKQGFCQKQ